MRYFSGNSTRFFPRYDDTILLNHIILQLKIVPSCCRENVQSVAFSYYSVVAYLSMFSPLIISERKMDVQVSEPERDDYLSNLSSAELQRFVDLANIDEFIQEIIEVRSVFFSS